MSSGIWQCLPKLKVGLLHYEAARLAAEAHAAAPDVGTEEGFISEVVVGAAEFASRREGAVVLVDQQDF